MREEMGHGLLKQIPFWNLFPIGFFIEDQQSGEQAYRLPYDAYERLMKVPLKNQSGEWFNTDKERRDALKDAYRELGTVLF